jgi:hypothetical protein
MKKHDVANLVVSIQEAAKQIRTLTASSRITELCDDLNKWTLKLEESLALKSAINEIKERRIDGTS